MKKINPKDIDDDLFMYFEQHGEYPTEWEQVTFFDDETDLAVVSVNGIYGVVNRNGEVVIPIIYDDAMGHFSDGLLAVKKGQKWGYVDAHHNIVIPFEYDNLYTYGSAVDAIFIYNGSPKGTADYFRNGTVLVRKNDKISIIDKQNKTVFPFIYKSINSTNCKYLCVSHDEQKYGLVDYKNTIILSFVYDNLTTIYNNENYFCFSEKADEQIENYDRENCELLTFKNNLLLKFGIIDNEGNIIVPAISYMDIRNFIDGKAMCFDYHKDEFFVYDSNKKESIYAPEDLQEDETETVRVNYIRNLMGMEPVFYK